MPPPGGTKTRAQSPAGGVCVQFLLVEDNLSREAAVCGVETDGTCSAFSPRMECETRPAGTTAASARPVASLMRRHWIATSPSAPVPEVEQLMRIARLRQIPVEAAGVLVGLVDHRRLLASALAGLRDGSAPVDAPRIASLMDPRPPTARPDETLGAAAQRMHEARLGCLPVVDGEGHLIGLVVESDLLRSLYGGGTAPD